MWSFAICPHVAADVTVFHELLEERGLHWSIGRLFGAGLVVGRLVVAVTAVVRNITWGIRIRLFWLIFRVEIWLSIFWIVLLWRIHVTLIRILISLWFYWLFLLLIRHYFLSLMLDIVILHILGSILLRIRMNIIQKVNLVSLIDQILRP